MCEHGLAWIKYICMFEFKKNVYPDTGLIENQNGWNPEIRLHR